jgi:enoyl-CoA hydratase
MRMADPHATAPLDTDRDGPVLTLTLRRPAAGNALDPTLVGALLDVFERLDPHGLRLIVLRGAGGGFCSGFDLGGLDAQSDGDLLLRVVRIELLLDRIRHAPLPTLGLAHRFAFGAGADLFAACTWRIAAPGTRFAFPGAGFGLVLGTRRLAGLVGPQAALDMTLRGHRPDAEEALSLGLVTALAAPEAWQARADTLAAELGAATPAAQPLLRRAALSDASRDSDLADLVRSAALPGLGARIRAYAEAARATRQTHHGGTHVGR